MLHLGQENSPATSKTCTFNYINSSFPALLLWPRRLHSMVLILIQKNKKKKKKKKKTK